MDNQFDGDTAKLIRELTTAGVAVRDVPKGNTPVAIVPQGYQVLSLEQFVQNDRSERPNRIKQAVEVWDAPSFIDYFLKFRDESSRVFADITSGTVTAILDYHEFKDSEEGTLENSPRWGSHTVKLALKKSPEWMLWTANNKKVMDQDTFATFMEDNTPDIVEPSAATMREIASDLHETHEMNYGSTATAANGSKKLLYTQDNKSTFGKTDTTVPEAFKIGIPVYIGGGMVGLVARLRWRVNSGKVSFWYDLLRADAAERAAFEASRTEVSGAIESVIINGVAR